MSTDLEPRTVLQAYVRSHNGAVESHRFESLLDLFTEDAELQFHGFPHDFPPFRSRTAIAEAFARHPPDDLILISHPTETGPNSITARYAWQAAPDDQEGSLLLETRGARIARLTIVHD